MINLGSISNKLAFLVLLAVLPALFILFYTGMEQRRHSIESAERDVLLLTRTMAESQEEITRFTRLILSTLSLMPAIQDLDLQASGDVFRSVLEQNPVYNNITLTALDGKVLAAGRTFTETNLADRKHFREALEKKDFVVGEYIVSRVGSFVPAFAFAYPVLDDKGRPKAVLTMAIKLADFSDLHDVANLPEKSFVAVTDHKGIRLFYYPHREETNPVGEPIQSDAWETARQTRGKGIFIGVGSDGARRIFAFEPVRLTPEDPPYLYVWAGIPEARILAPANAVLVRNLLLMLMATVMALFISWLIGKNTLISPIQSLLVLARKFAQGDLEARSELSGKSDEFLTLTKAFHDMAVALGASQRILVENEARFRLLMDSQDAIVYVADMDTYEVLFINEHGRKMFGDVTGKICWQSLQLGQSGPCSFCTNKYLLNGEGKPGGMYAWEFQNTISGQWFYIQDRAIKWSDGRIVRLEIATDISEKKRAEAELSAEKERLAVTLRSIGDGVITTDVSGKIVLLNKVAEKLTGWSSEEVSGRPLAEVFRIVNEKTREICENPVTKVISSGQIVGLANHTVLIAKDGKELSIADSGAPILDALGNIVGVVLVFRDVTEQINTEKELHRNMSMEMRHLYL
ncbi:MAG: PAS domain S-box protein [Pseudomonadota bacterium]